MPKLSQRLFLWAYKIIAWMLECLHEDSWFDSCVRSEQKVNKNRIFIWTWARRRHQARQRMGSIWIEQRTVLPYWKINFMWRNQNKQMIMNQNNQTYLSINAINFQNHIELRTHKFYHLQQDPTKSFSLLFWTDCDFPPLDASLPLE